MRTIDRHDISTTCDGINVIFGLGQTNIPNSSPILDNVDCHSLLEVQWKAVNEERIANHCRTIPVQSKGLSRSDSSSELAPTLRYTTVEGKKASALYMMNQTVDLTVTSASLPEVA